MRVCKGEATGSGPAPGGPPPPRENPNPTHGLDLLESAGKPCKESSNSVYDGKTTVSVRPNLDRTFDRNDKRLRYGEFYRSSIETRSTLAAAAVGVVAFLAVGRQDGVCVTVAGAWRDGPAVFSISSLT